MCYNITIIPIRGFFSLNSNNNRQYHSNVPRAAASTGQGTPPQGDKSKGFDVIILIELFLLILAVISTLIFCSFLRLEYHFEYVTSENPSKTAFSAQNEPEEKIYEREIPIVEPLPEPDEKLEYDFSSPVPECEAYPLEHFSNAAFIGDSRIAGLIMYTKLDPINYSATGFNLKSFANKKYITHVDEDGNKSLVSCAEALELDNGKYDSIYLSTGVNELGWNSKTFFSSYREIIRAIRKITDVPIYVQLILPVTTAYEERSTNGITNAKQAEFNEGLRTIIEEEKVFMLDPISSFSLEDGSLDPEKSNDGAHLEKFACAELLEYYQTHVVDIELYSNLYTADETSDD